MEKAMHTGSSIFTLLKPNGAVLLTAGLLLVLACSIGSVTAAEMRNGMNKLDRTPPGNSFAPVPGISIEKAAAIARKNTGGRVLSATSQQRRSGTEYRIRMLVDGERVITVIVDHKGRIKNKP